MPSVQVLPVQSCEFTIRIVQVCRAGQAIVLESEDNAEQERSLVGFVHKDVSRPFVVLHAGGTLFIGTVNH